MPLTTPQLQALKADISANTTAITFAGVSTQIKDIPNSSDGNDAIKGWYNQAHATWTIWRKAVGLSEIAKNLNGTELAGLSSLNHTRLQTVITLTNASGGANPSLTDQRQFWDDIFSGAGGTNTRAALLILWKELASNAEKLFSAGTGSNGSPAITDSNIGEGFQLSAADVNTARNLA